MFGLGFAEIAVIVLVAIVVFGPDRLPEIARTAGRTVRTLRAMVADAKAQLSEEIGHDVIEDLKSLDPRIDVRGPTPPAKKSSLNPGEKPPFDREAT